MKIVEEIQCCFILKCYWQSKWLSENLDFTLQLSSVQFSRSVVSDSLRPHGLQCTKPPCPSPTPRVSDLQIELLSLTSPALASRFFTTSATWEVLAPSGYKLLLGRLIAKCLLRSADGVILFVWLWLGTTQWVPHENTLKF